MHQTAEEKISEPPRRRWGDGIRRRRLQRAQSAPVGSPSPPIPKQDTSAGNAASAGTDSLATLLEERSKELLLRRPDRISITYARKSNDEKLGLCLRVVTTAGSTDGTKNNKTNSKAGCTKIQIDGKCPTTGDGGPLSQINSSALRDKSQHSLTFFEPGDVLEAVNDLDCRTVTNLGEINAHLETRSRAYGNVNDNADDENNGSKNTADVHAVENNLSTHPPLTTIAVSTSGNQQNDTALTTLGVQLCQRNVVFDVG